MNNQCMRLNTDRHPVCIQQNSGSNVSQYFLVLNTHVIERKSYDDEYLKNVELLENYTGIFTYVTLLPCYVTYLFLLLAPSIGFILIKSSDLEDEQRT